MRAIHVTIFLGIMILIANSSRAQTCGEQAYKDVSDCQTVFNGVQNASNSQTNSVSASTAGQGFVIPAVLTDATGNWAAGSWTQAQQYCRQKLADCQQTCNDPADKQYLDACNNQISQIIAVENQAGSVNRSIASAGGAIASAAGDDATVQQVGLLGQTTGLCRIGMLVVNCYLNPGAQPTIADAAQRPAIMQISPNQMAIGGR